MTESQFDARDQKCAKCGSDDILVRWHGKGGDHRSRDYAVCEKYGRDNGNPPGEHLHFHCRTCQWDWFTETADVCL